MNRTGRLAASLCLISLWFGSALCHAEPGAHTPSPGSPEREAIMDVMRLDFYAGDRAAAHQNAKRILFKVRFLKVDGDWALASVDPVNSEGKEIAEPRWSLLRRQSGQWTDAKYFDALRPFPSEESAQEALEMNRSTIGKIQSVFPEAPKDIFPSHANQ